MFSFSFSGMLASAEKAMEAVAPVVQPVIAAAEALAPVVAATVPSTAPAINAVEAGAATIAKIAPTAVADANAAIAAGKAIVADASPVLTQLESIFSGLFHATPAPGGAIVLTPKTTAATVPVA